MFDFSTEILPALQDWYENRVFNLILQIVCIVAFVIFVALLCKYVLIMPIKKVVFGITVIIGLIGILILSIRFNNVIDKEVKDKEYIVENNATIYVYEDSAPLIDHFTDIKLTTSNGQTIMLKLHSAHNLSRKQMYTGSFVYTKRSKELLLYNFSD